MPSPGRIIYLNSLIEKVKPYFLIFSFVLTIISILLKLNKIIDLTFFSYFYMLIFVFWAADSYHILLKILNSFFNNIWCLPSVRQLRLHGSLYTMSGATFAGDVCADKDYGVLRNPQLNVNLSDNASSTPSSASTSSTTASSSTHTAATQQNMLPLVPNNYVFPKTLSDYKVNWILTEKAETFEKQIKKAESLGDKEKVLRIFVRQVTGLMIAADRYTEAKYGAQNLSNWDHGDRLSQRVLSSCSPATQNFLMARSQHNDYLNEAILRGRR